MLSQWAERLYVCVPEQNKYTTLTKLSFSYLKTVRFYRHNSWLYFDKIKTLSLQHMIDILVTWQPTWEERHSCRDVSSNQAVQCDFGVKAFPALHLNDLPVQAFCKWHVGHLTFLAQKNKQLSFFLHMWLWNEWPQSKSLIILFDCYLLESWNSNCDFLGEAPLPMEKHPFSSLPTSFLLFAKPFTTLNLG